MFLIVCNKAEFIQYIESGLNKVTVDKMVKLIFSMGVTREQILEFLLNIFKFGVFFSKDGSVFLDNYKKFDIIVCVSGIKVFSLLSENQCDKENELNHDNFKLNIDISRKCFTLNNMINIMKVIKRCCEFAITYKDALVCLNNRIKFTEHHDKLSDDNLCKLNEHLSRIYDNVSFKLI
jgi:hypothetical protein